MRRKRGKRFPGDVIPVPTTLEEALQVIQKLLEENARLAARIDELEARLAKYEGKPPTDPNTPSGMTPPYLKPSRKPGKTPGQKPGHPGNRREPPKDIDRRVHHALVACPECGTPISQNSITTRKRYTEDVPKIRSEVTEHTIDRGWCPHCRKIVEAKVADALPVCTLGLHTVLVAAWMHYGLGVSVHKAVRFLGSVCRMQVTVGGLVQAFARLAEALMPFHDAVWEEVRRSGVLHADETGWRVMGKTWWLWCFAAKGAVLYVIDRTRASPVVLEVLGEVFRGVLVCDFFGSYNAIAALAKQRCMVHLLRELKKVSLKNRNAQWVSFQRRLKRLIRDAVELGRDRGRYDDAAYERAWKRLHARLFDLYSAAYTDADCRRLAKRLERHRDELFTFLEHEGVSSDNNEAEREIRPAVLMRKNYFGNRSLKGAAVQAVFMTLFRTLEKRGLDPVAALENAMRHRILHGSLPPFDRIDQIDRPQNLPMAA